MTSGVLFTTTELQRDTLQLDEVVPEDDLGRLLTLTIIGHPDVARCGEYTVLRRAIPINRLEPTFCRPDGRYAGPLVDPFLSRKPVFSIDPLGDRAGIERQHPSTDIVVDGTPLSDRLEVGEQRLSQGAVIVLQDRVVLLLHLRDELPTGADAQDLRMVGSSDAIRRVRRRVHAVGPTNATTLILGETGVGKELVADAIHRASARASEPIVSVNVGALEPSVLTSTLFGHTRGAFTGALGPRAGLFREANGGTLFLDEIGDAPPGVQRALLRVLETREVVPVGSDRPEPVDVRLLAATDAHLTAARADGPIRAQLLHRLAQFVIEVPRLRDRAEDLSLLFLHFVREQAAELGALDRLMPEGRTSTPWIRGDTIAQLYAYGWPGNIRELRNLAIRSVISSVALPTLVLDWGVRGELLDVPDDDRTPLPSAGHAEQAKPRTTRPLSDVTDAELLAALAAADWRPVPAARALGISKTSIYQLIRANPSIPQSALLEEAEIRRALAASPTVADAARALRVPERGLRVRMTTLGVESSD